MLAWTLVNYGGYLCDDTYARRATFNTESGFTAQFEAAWGYVFEAASGSGAWYTDVVALFRALSIVANNAPDSQGGGGTPLQPPSPPLCDAL